MAGLTKIEENVLRAHGWYTVDELRAQRTAQQPQPDWQVECAREVMGHLFSRVGIPVWQIAEECGVSGDRLRSYLDGELQDLAPQEVGRIQERIAEIARAEAFDYERGVITGETAGHIVQRHKLQHEGK